MSINYEDFVIDTNDFQANKINLFEAATNTRVILDTIDESIFKDVLNYVFKNKFHFSNFENVIIQTDSKIKKITELEYNDFDINFTTINLILNKNNDK